MFVIRIQLTLQAATRDAFRQWVVDAGLAARALTGCVEYTFGEDVADPLRVILYEEWTTQADFEAYKQSAVFAATSERLRPMLAQPPKSAYFRAENVFA